MNVEQSTEIIKQITGILVLGKPENRTMNLLSVLGLFPTDFDLTVPLIVSYDAVGILVEAQAFTGKCTCNADTKNPRLHVIPGDTERHSSKCEAYRASVIALHPQLVDVENTERDDRPKQVFLFQWPRTFESRHKNVLITRFGELEADTLWKNFEKVWTTRIVAMMPEPAKSYAERLNDQEQGEPEVGIEPSVQESESVGAEMPLDFGDMSFDVTDVPSTEPISTPAESVTNAAPEKDKPLEEVAKETARKRKGKKAEEVPPAEEKPTETTAPAGETITSGETQIELKGEAAPLPEEKPKDEKPEKEKGKAKSKDEPKKKINPAILKFVDMVEEEISSLRTTLENLKTTEGFPVETIKMLKSRFDRLGIKTAHLVFRGGHELERSDAINPLIEITLANVSGQVNSAVRDLGLSPEKPNSWLDFKKELKSAEETANSMSDIMAQMGVSDAIQGPPKLKDASGKALVD